MESAAEPAITASDAEVLSHVRKHWEGIVPNSPIYRIFFSDIEIVSATNGRIVARLPLQNVHINSKKILHGAVSAALVDWAGGMAIASTGLDKSGVSVDIHISYASSAKEGDTLEVEAWVSRAGKTLAFTNVEIRKVSQGNVKGTTVATGSHTKYLNVGRA